MYRLHCQGDDLADPEAYERANELWLDQVRKNPDDPKVRDEAVAALQFCSPDQAEQILTQAKDRAGLVGGNVEEKNVLRKVPPIYPVEARGRGIEGTVQMTAVIGLDGKIVYLRAIAGPQELIPASLAAVQHWEYKPTLLNGKPCYVITRIDVNYILSPH